MARHNYFRGLVVEMFNPLPTWPAQKIALEMPEAKPTISPASNATAGKVSKRSLVRLVHSRPAVYFRVARMRLPTDARVADRERGCNAQMRFSGPRRLDGEIRHPKVRSWDSDKRGGVILAQA